MTSAETVSATERSVWAIACGSWDRDYFDDVFFKYGVALVGCYGLESKWSESIDCSSEFQALGRNSKNSIRAIAKVKKNDIVIAKQGTRRARAVGVVEEGYDFNESIAEVQGWDLFHQVRVKWLESSHTFHDGPQPFRPWTAHRVNNQAASEWARGVIRDAESTAVLKLPLPGLPKDEEPLRAREISPWFKEVGETAKSLQLNWGWDEMSESSAVAHILVPMLISLGWERHQIRLEFDWVDIAVLDDEGSPALLVEAKAPRFGISAALSQVMGYRKKGISKRKWSPETPVLATTGFAFVLMNGDTRDDAYSLRPTTKAKRFMENMEAISPNFKK